MMPLLARGLALLVALASGACAQPTTEPAAPRAPEATARTMAITIDDLPVGRGHGLAHQQRVTRDLLAQIEAADVPVIGFVNEGKLDERPGEREARIELLQAWVDAGHELGNHTYDHPSFFRTPLAQFQEEVVRGEPVTRALLAARGSAPTDSLHFFRHPFLNVGPDLETKRAFEAWIAARGYRIAPVTHDNAEYIYAHAYDIALDRGDAALQARIADAYIAYMDTTAAYYEGLSRDLFSREIPGILLLHSNALNADHLTRLVDTFRARGYVFNTLDEALEDPAYASEDTYVGRAGMSWLQRWAITREVRFTSEPLPHDWVIAVTQP
ncbi:MAG: polysaccharide deacetylase family protein [Bacteroidota bacterium]